MVLDFNNQGMDQAWSLRGQSPSPLESPWMVEVTCIQAEEFCSLWCGPLARTSPVKDRW